VGTDDGDDVVGQGEDRPPRPGWRPLSGLGLPPGWRPRSGWQLTWGGAVLATVTLVVGLVAGYSTGYLRLRHGPPVPPGAGAAGATPAAPTGVGPGGPAVASGAGASSGSGYRSTITVTIGPESPGYLTQLPPPSVSALGPALTQSIPGCSAQVGKDLQLGIQVTNQSAAQVTIGQIKPVLPLGGLRAISVQWGPCGALPATQDIPGNVLAPGASAWFTMTFKVLRGCPGPLPVEFKVEYDSNGQTATASLPGFPDLGQVPYGSCPVN
jgi:hypothetical protein